MISFRISDIEIFGLVSIPYLVLGFWVNQIPTIEMAWLITDYKAQHLITFRSHYTRNHPYPWDYKNHRTYSFRKLSSCVKKQSIKAKTGTTTFLLPKSFEILGSIIVWCNNTTIIDHRGFKRGLSLEGLDKKLKFCPKSGRKQSFGQNLSFWQAPARMITWCNPKR